MNSTNNNGNSDRRVKVTKTTMDHTRTNHPGWYEHYDTSKLIALNLANKQDVPYNALGSSEIILGNIRLRLPAVASVGIQLTTPRGDQEGWHTGIRLLWQQLRTANSGKINITIYDLERYVQNVRALRAIMAFLSRTYKMTYTYRSTNAFIPENLLRAEGLNPQSIISNAANLFMYIQRFYQEVRLSFPLNIDYLRRADWLFSNVFLDSDKSKPQMYVTNFARGNKEQNSGGIWYWTSSGFLNTGVATIWTPHVTWYEVDNANDYIHELWDYDTLVNQCNLIKDALIQDSAMSAIAGDIIKAFGDRAFLDYPIAKIDDAIEAVYDETILNQFQNANVLGATTSDIIDLMSIIPTSGPSLSNITAPVQKGVGYYETGNTNWIDNGLENNVGKANTNVLAQIVDRTDGWLLNWHRDTIGPGEIMSISRFVPCGVVVTNTDPELTKFAYATFGTEVVTYVSALVQIEQDNGVFPVWIPIAGNIQMAIDLGYAEAGPTEPGYISAYQIIAAVWAMYDWAPRYRGIGKSTDVAAPQNRAIQIGPDALDWDIFAATDSTQMALYFSYGNQSLLYAGASQNQSDTKVYMKSSEKKNDKAKRHKAEDKYPKDGGGPNKQESKDGFKQDHK